ncbi:MAG TPA: ABC transporter ATP-binding protein [Acidothermaceae bacterium]|jgi:ABC-2 type transport system ATP-binding protein
MYGRLADTDTPVVVVRDLVKRYGRLRAVDGLSFDVRRGEIFAVLGPNGAGKTTTLEVLEGHLAPTAGTVRVLGADPLTGGRRHRDRVGIVLQSGGLDGELTVTESLRLFAAFYTRTLGVRKTAELVGLGDKLRAKVRTLSGGQQRRLDLGVALIGDPEVLFLDEPTTGFDPDARRQAWDMVTSLRALGKTVLLTSHYMDEVQSLADRVAVISRGRMVAQSTPGQLGGRDLAEAVISLRIPYPGWDSDLPNGPWHARRSDGVELRLQTTKPTEAVWTLSRWAVDRGEELVGLTVTRPSLEDAYLRLTRAGGGDEQR